MTCNTRDRIDINTADRAERLHAAGLISRFVLAAARTPEPDPGPGAWSMLRRLQRATVIVDDLWRSFAPSPTDGHRPAASHVERELTTNRLRAIHIVSQACGWRDMHQFAASALRGDELAKRKLRRMLRPQPHGVPGGSAAKR